MTGANLNRLEGFAEDLPRFFYLVMAAALIAVLIGSPRSGLFLLIVGAAAHVVRASLEDFIASQRAREDVSKARPRKRLTPMADARPAMAAQPLGRRAARQR